MVTENAIVSTVDELDALYPLAVVREVNGARAFFQKESFAGHTDSNWFMFGDEVAGSRSSNIILPAIVLEVGNEKGLPQIDI
jgi:hypothetical protein